TSTTATRFPARPRWVQNGGTGRRSAYIPTSRSYVARLRLKWENIPWRAGDMLVRKVGQIPPSRTAGSAATPALSRVWIKLAIAGGSPAAAHCWISGVLAASIPMRTSCDDDIVSDPQHEYSIFDASERGFRWRQRPRWSAQSFPRTTTLAM